MENVINSIVSMANGLECYYLRDLFLTLQEDENSTNEQLITDSLKWNSYLELYCKAHRKLTGNFLVH